MSTSVRAQAVETPHGEGVKDTIESIVVALILAFVFRAFVVEAFVIPTGSMAPTLYGAHGTIICEDCGTEFAYGLKDSSDKRRDYLVGPEAAATCPNCQHPNKTIKINDLRGNAESGDRILVLKWPFDIGGDLLGPARWDVTVFKNPANGVENYIKRLIGMPGEVLMILDGDVYTVPNKHLSPEALEEFDRLRHEKYEHRKGVRRGRLRRVSEGVLAELDRKLTIARKTAATQRALWLPVHDHDYPPESRERGQPYWKSALGEDSGWDVSSRRVLFVDRGRQADYIGLSGTRIAADYAYNIRRVRPTPVPPLVSDHRVRFVLTPKGPEGVVRIRLSKLGRTFWATVHTDGLVSISESRELPGSGTQPMLERRLRPLTANRSVEISFENLDYRLALSVRGEEVLATTGERDSASGYGPDVRRLRKMRRSTEVKAPRIYAEDGDFELAHLVVERDIHYYDTRAAPSVDSWAPSGWGTAGNPILLRPGEYFMLGDNSAASQDSRLWGTVGSHLEPRGEGFQLGTVPEDQLIGKAFYVYWPMGHRLDWLEFFRWGIIPDVGRMRWIR